MQRTANGTKRSTFGSYASSIVSQDAATGGGGTDAASVAGSAAPTERSGHVAFSQSDRIGRGRRLSLTSAAGVSDMGSLAASDYKSQDDAAELDDIKSQYGGTQSGVTVF